jgi:enoyl-CoA hydratase
MGETETMHLDRHDSVAVLTIDRPHRRNALDPPTIHALAGALRAATDDPSTRVVVLTATGDVAFGSGMDLHALAEDRDAAGLAVRALHDVMWSSDRVPLVAAVNGAAMAGGFELALRCDLVVAAEHATFGLPEARRGLLAGGGSTLLPCRIPLAVALELGLTGQPISAARAYELGLVNRVVPGSNVVPAALELARSIALCAPLAVAWMRRAMWASLNGSAAGWAETAAGQAVVSQSEDMREGLRAFREKRPPHWTGR